jgi:hypothetical protein
MRIIREYWIASVEIITRSYENYSFEINDLLERWNYFDEFFILLLDGYVGETFTKLSTKSC